MSKLNLDQALYNRTLQLTKQGYSSLEATRIAGKEIEKYLEKTAKVSVNQNGVSVRTARPVSNNAGDPGSSVKHVGYTSSHTKPT